MNFGLTDEQRLIVEVAREFTERELFPYEGEVERTGRVRSKLVEQIRSRSIDAGMYAANMPSSMGARAWIPSRSRSLSGSSAQPPTPSST